MLAWLISFAKGKKQWPREGAHLPEISVNLMRMVRGQTIARDQNIFGKQNRGLIIRALQERPSAETNFLHKEAVRFMVMLEESDP